MFTAAAVVYFVLKESDIPIGAKVREWATGGAKDPAAVAAAAAAATAAAAAAEGDDGSREYAVMKRMQMDPTFEKKVMKKAKAAGGDSKVMIDLGWKASQESNDPDAKEIALAMYELAKVEAKRRGGKRRAKKN